jgi:hypothetical protein
MMDGEKQKKGLGGNAVIKKFYESVVAIECDACMLAEFRPELDDDDSVAELVEVWGQACSVGWRQIITSDGDQHFCPTCAATAQIVMEAEIGKI